MEAEINPVGRPTTYDPAYCERVLEFGRAGKSKTQIAVALGTSKASLDRWAEAHEEFRTALTRAQEAAQAWWEDVGQTALFADKFQAAVWKKSVEARFREDYTERREDTNTIKADETISGLMARVATRGRDSAA